MLKKNKKKSVSILVNFLLVCLSLSPLVGVEIYLQSINYGYEDRLFIFDKGSETYVLNRELYKKYFTVDLLAQNTGIPTLFPEIRFKAKKEVNDFRIICMGGSTTRGNYSHKSFPSLLEEMFSRSVIHKKIEVINLGIPTVNSFQVSDFVREIVNYEPDLLIIYMGHNEIYGPLGVASTSQISSSYRLTALVMYMQKLKTFQLLQNLYLEYLEIDSDKERKGTLFQVMAESRVVPDSTLRKKSLRYYEQNLDKIIEQTEKRRIPLIVTTIASNLRDFRPFDSEVPPSGPLANEWQTLLESAFILQQEQSYQGAEEKFLAAIGLFPENAQQYYDLGQLYLAQENYDAALEAFTKARDLDIIPFRAPSAINDVLKRKMAESSAILLDVEKIFKTKSAGGVIGKPIMVEHLHPSSYGHYLIATGLSKLIFDYGLLKQEKEVEFDDPVVQSSFDVKINAEFFEAKIIWPFTINNKDYSFP